jgi:predicted tellurium resistance membrane protein TerC
VITAVGLTQNIPVIVAAMTVAMLVMLFAANWVSEIINKYPTLKILALSFIMLVGGFLFAEGFGFDVPKGYIYFAMFFSLAVEMVNIKLRNKIDRKKSK